MRYFKASSAEEGAVRRFQDACLHENLHIVIRKRAINLLKHIVENTTPPKELLTRAQLEALERRGFIRNDGKKVVHTELGLLALAFAEAADVIHTGGNVVNMRRRG